MMILQYLVFLTLWGMTKFQKIIPRPGRYIELSANNQGSTVDYIFHFYLQNDSFEGKSK